MSLRLSMCSAHGTAFSPDQQQKNAVKQQQQQQQ